MDNTLVNKYNIAVAYVVRIRQQTADRQGGELQGIDCIDMYYVY